MRYWEPSTFSVILAAAFGFGRAKTAPPARSPTPPASLERSLRATSPPAPAKVNQCADQGINPKKVAENDVENNKKLHDYTYSERREQHKLDGKGAISSTETRPSMSTCKPTRRVGCTG